MQGTHKLGNHTSNNFSVLFLLQQKTILSDKIEVSVKSSFNGSNRHTSCQISNQNHQKQTIWRQRMAYTLYRHKTQLV